MVDALIPILTKCNPKKKIDIEEIRSTLADQIENDLQSQVVSQVKKSNKNVFPNSIQHSAEKEA